MGIEIINIESFAKPVQGENGKSRIASGGASRSVKTPRSGLRKHE
jgi:hypothetical protein